MPEPLACLDAAYSDDAASAACGLFADWDAAAPLRILTLRQAAAAAYEPGAFYKRELPILLAVLNALERLPRLLIVDGYVWLDDQGRPGLGAMLHGALGKRIPVVGVAKTRFAGASAGLPVIRGGSRRPLYVSAVGLDAAEAAQGVQRMAGHHRIPTMLRLVDRAARAALSQGEAQVLGQRGSSVTRRP
jgi:deoxyribonuclease V